MRLTPKQERFVAEYLIDLNGKQAAIRAGYKPSRAEGTASELLALGKVSEAVAAGRTAQLAKLGVSAERVKQRLALIGFQDIRQLFDEQGNLRPIHTLSDEAAAFVAGLEIIKKNAAAGDGIIDTVHKVKVVDPIKALEMLAKHFGLLTDKVDVSGAIELSWRSSE